MTGALAGGPPQEWYRSLDTPTWQPPAKTFPAVWTPLYASIAWAAGRALETCEPVHRRGLAVSLGVNLALNGGWTWLFFRLRSPLAGALGALLLDASNADLVRRTARCDRKAAVVLVPYAAWCAFATVLSAEIARRNR